MLRPLLLAACLATFPALAAEIRVPLIGVDGKVYALTLNGPDNGDTVLLCYEQHAGTLKCIASDKAGNAFSFTIKPNEEKPT